MIREIEANDNEMVRRVIQTVMPEFGCVGPGYAISDPEVNRMFESYQGEGHRYFVVDIEGEVVGGAGIAPLLGGDAAVCELRKMYLMPKVRGRGFGKLLIDHCLEFAKRSYKGCYLETTDRMQAAQDLYRRVGFQRLEERMGKTGHFSCECWYHIDLNA